jgi:hypothetical protein
MARAWPRRAGRLRLLLTDSHEAGDYEMTLQYPHRALLAPRVRVTVEHLLQAFARREELHLSPQALAPFVA